MIDIRAGGGVIRIGRVQENEYRRVVFDVADVLRDYPDAVFTVMNQRIQDAEAYPVPSAQLSVEGGTLYWTLKAGDLAYEGVGRCEVIARSGSVVAKSAVWSVWVEEALDGNAEPPAPWEGWVEQVTEAAERAEAAAELLESPGAEAETLAPGSAATAAYSDGVFSFGIPQGEQGPAGADGQDGQDGYTPVRGTDYWTAADQAAIIADVEADLIDDTAAAGDTTKVWSADKSSSELSGVLSALDGVVGEVYENTEESVSISNTASKVINSSGAVVSYSNSGYGVTNNIDVTGYIKVKVTASAGYSCYYYAFYDENNNFISGSQSPSSSSAAISEEEADVPSNASYLVAAHYSGATNSVTGVVRHSVIDKLESTIVTYSNDTQIPYTMNNGKLLYANGTVNDYSNNGYGVTSEVDISGYDSLKVTGGVGYGNLIYGFYDSSHTFISGYQSPSNTTVTITDQAANIPDNAKYIRVAKHTSVTVSIKGVKNYTRPKSPAKWYGKKWVVIGDSLTEHNTRTTKNYHDYIAEKTGITVVNMGVSGTGYRNGGSGSNPFYSRVSSVPTDADVVTIFGSFNDGITDLGTATDTGTTTIGGCINTTIDNLYTAFPTVQLGIVSPTPWVGANPYNHSEANVYAELLEEICKRRSIPFLNLYFESNLRPWDSTFRTLAYSKDEGNGVHPDETGHEIISSRFEGFLDSLLLT